MLDAWCLMLVACLNFATFHHLAKFLDHFLPIRLLLEACSLRQVSSPEDFPFILIIGPADFHCLDRIRSSAWRDFSWPWLAFVISKLIFIILLLLTHHIIVASLWLVAFGQVLPNIMRVGRLHTWPQIQLMTLRSEAVSIPDWIRAQVWPRPTSRSL